MIGMCNEDRIELKEEIQFDLIFEEQRKKMYIVTYHKNEIEKTLKVYIQLKDDKKSPTSVYYWSGGRWIPLHGDQHIDSYYFNVDWKKWISVMIQYDFFRSEFLI